MGEDRDLDKLLDRAQSLRNEAVALEDEYQTEWYKRHPRDPNAPKSLVDLIFERAIKQMYMQGVLSGLVRHELHK